MAQSARYVSWLNSLTRENAHAFGIKSEELVQILEADLKIQEGFAVSPSAYSEFIRENNFTQSIKNLLSSTNYNNPGSIEQVSFNIRNLLKKGLVPNYLVKEIVSSYRKLGSFLEEAYVTVSPSPTHRSHVQQQDNSLTIKGDAILIDFIKDAWSTLFTPLSIFNNHTKHKNEDIGIAIIIQKTHNPNFSGSLNTENNEIKTDSQDILPHNLLLELESIARIINNHYYFPQNISWIASNNLIYITSVKPITQHEANEDPTHFQLKGHGSGNGISSGPVQRIVSLQDAESFKNGSVLLTQELNDKNSDLLKTASAAIVEHDSVISHKLYNDYGIPIVYGVKDTSNYLNDGEMITVNSIKGEVYKGGLYDSLKRDIRRNISPRTITKIFVNLSDDTKIESDKNVDGIIFSPEEIIKNIGIHPKKIIADQKQSYFVGEIAGKIAAVSNKFKDNFIMYKLSNLTTSDYRNLEEGAGHEPQELNPAFGFRGSLRHTTHEDILELEINAIKKAYSLGSDYLGIIVPFARSAEELVHLIKILEKNGLERSSRFRIWMSIQTPAVAFSLDKFIDMGIDGVMIEAVSLLSFMLGVDSSDPEIFNRYKYSDETLLHAITKALESAKMHQVFTCLDQTQSIQSELIRKSVFLGVNSINVQPDELNQVKMLITQAERELLRKP